MRAFYNFKTFKSQNCEPIIKKIIATYSCIKFAIFVITTLFILNFVQQNLGHDLAIYVAKIFAFTFLTISIILTFILWVILKKSISPIVSLIIQTKSKKTLKKLDIPNNISDEIIQLYEITNKSIEKINKYQHKKIEFKKNAAIAMTTQMLAHDIRKPFQFLNMALKTLSLIEEPENKNEFIKKIMNDLNKNIKKVDGMLIDILESGRTSNKPNYVLINPSEFILNIIREVSEIYNASNIKFTYSFKNQNNFLIDPLKIERVFSNLLVNAFDAMNLNGHIWINCTEIIQNSKPFLEFCFGNNNSYIPEDKLKKIFKNFYSEKKSGTGLGLSIVQKIIQNHGGKIYCLSLKNEEFLTGKVEFWFTLPCALTTLKPC